MLTSEDQETDPLVRSQTEEVRRQGVEVHLLTLGAIDPNRLCRAVDQVILEVHQHELTHLHAQFTKYPVCLARLVSRRMGSSTSLGIRLSDLQPGGLDLSSLPGIVKTARSLVADSEASLHPLPRRLRKATPD